MAPFLMKEIYTHTYTYTKYSKILPVIMSRSYGKIIDCILYVYSYFYFLHYGYELGFFQICFNIQFKNAQELITGLYDKDMYSFVRNSDNLFQSDCTILHPTGNVWVIHFFHILSSMWYLFLILAILRGV